MKYLLFTILSLFVLQIQAQDIDEIYHNHLDSLIEEVIFEDAELSSLLGGNSNFQFLYGRLNFESNTYYAGRDLGNNQLNTTGQLVYFHSCGLNVALSGVWYEKLEPRYAATAVSVGYSRKFNFLKDFRFRASYDRYFYSSNDSVTDYTFNSSINFGTTYRKKWGGSRVGFSLLTGNETRGQISWDFFADFVIAKFGFFDKLEFEPEVSFFFGSEDVIDVTVGRVIGPLGRPRPSINYFTSTEFGLMNTELQFPLTLSLSNFDFELGYNINLPHSLDPDFNYDVTGYLNFSVGYILSLK